MRRAPSHHHNLKLDLPQSALKNQPVQLNRYYVGRASGDFSERELFNQAYEDAKNSAITENYGVLTQISKQSYESLESNTAINRVNETSKLVILKQFQKTEQYINGNSVWILYKYPKSEIAAELKRLETKTASDKPIEFSELNATSSANNGILEIVASPPDVNVTVDNQSFGLAPLRLRLSEGVHAVMIDHPHYQHIEEQVVVKLGMTTKLNKILMKAKRKILIKANLENAVVELGGKYLGTTSPIIETEVVAGEKLTLLASHPEAMPFKDEITIGKGAEPHSVELKLSLKPSYLSVNSVPQGAEVFFGEKRIGITPVPLFETRSTTVTIRKDGYKEYEKLIVLKGGEKQVLPTVNLISISEEEKRKTEYESQLLEYLYSSPIIISLGLGYSGGTMKDTDGWVFLGSIEKKIYGWAGVRLGVATRSGESRKERGNGPPNTSETYVSGVQATEYSLSIPIYLSGGWYLAPEAGSVSGKIQQRVRTYSPLGIDSDSAPFDTNFQQTFFGAAIGKSSFEKNLNPLGWYWEVGIKNYTDSGDFKGSSSINGKVGMAYRF